MGLLTQLCSHVSLILLRRTKVLELLCCFVHQALTPPRLCDAAYYQRGSVTRKIELSRIRSKIIALSTNVLVPLPGVIGKRSQCYT